MAATVHDWGALRKRDDGSVWRLCWRCGVVWERPKPGAKAHFERDNRIVKREEIMTCEAKQ